MSGFRVFKFKVYNLQCPLMGDLQGSTAISGKTPSLCTSHASFPMLLLGSSGDDATFP